MRGSAHFARFRFTLWHKSVRVAGKLTLHAPDPTLARKPVRPLPKSYDEPVGFGTFLLRVLRTGMRLVAYGFGALVALLLIYGVVPVPTTIHILDEWRRLGQIERDWVPIEDIAPELQRAVVAAEDANFCRHWGFDMAAIRDALADGATRGASTISQQTVKNAVLWHGRHWGRKAIEALLTPIMELTWTKRRILEVYLNVAEFGEGIFGAEAAARAHFGVSALELTQAQASRLAAVLPAPIERSASNPDDRLLRRASAITQGAETIAADGRDTCFID